MATGLQKLRAHISALELKHKKLEIMLTTEESGLYQDEDKITEIKKAKLQIRDQITKLENSINQVK